MELLQRLKWWSGIVAFLFFLGIELRVFSAGDKPLAPCLPFHGSVELEGTIKRETFAHSVELPPFNGPRVYWILHLPEPVCFDGGDDEFAYQNGDMVKRIQLVLSPDQYKKYKKQVNRNVRAQGALFAGITAHHFTKLLINVDRIVHNEK